MFEMLPAMQDRLFQRWLKSSQPCRVGCLEMLEKLTAMQEKDSSDVHSMSQPCKIGCSRGGQKPKVVL